MKRSRLHLLSNLKLHLSGVLFVFSFVISLYPDEAHAQSGKKKRSAKKSKQASDSKSQLEDFNDDSAIILETFELEGHREKPQAFYIIPRANLNYRDTLKPRSFIYRIKSSLKGAPFEYVPGKIKQKSTPNPVQKK